ncbi:hypothetical protein KR51_00018970 [Rubidibacter lacunae KORDI 51-2]|uniref:Uncharacterized protein n=1 Tax=Rubidibacter lacunae KORDI 51-2 TaxID=582515 RepID=U5DI32_9CHRO|nr:hypothetical protein [Rubidibacter lacunae]ERN41331.1 hypothetical protein KR51_00018970 [Rubidibacter lacunae KORDI 51-2]
MFLNVAELVAFLSPCLPFLLEKVGAPALNKAASRLGEDTWEKAKGIWIRLRSDVQLKPAAKVAAEKLAVKPDSLTLREDLSKELKSIFEKKPGLAVEIAEILEDAGQKAASSYVQQTIKTNQGQVIGQMSGGEAKIIGSIDATNRNSEL